MIFCISTYRDCKVGFSIHPELFQIIIKSVFFSYLTTESFPIILIDYPIHLNQLCNFNIYNEIGLI
jgi:hypothetical protein